MSYAINVIAIVLVAIVVAVAYYVFVTNLRNVEPPFPETGEKARFIRALTCSFAMCVRKSCDELIIAIQGSLDKDQEISCYKVCKELEKKEKCKEYKCGEDCSLEYKVDEEFTYDANYPVSATITYIPWIRTETVNSMQNDIMRYRNDYWYNYIHYDSVDRAHCYWDSWSTVTLDDFTVNMGCSHDVGVRWSTVDFSGLCEGSLRSSNGCNKGYTQTGASAEASTVGTGHIWIDPSITSQCKEFNTVETKSTGTKYYGYCTFNRDQTIYIWAEPDKAELTDAHCPELIVCSHG